MASLISEISTPLVNIRGLMQVHKMEDSAIFKLNDYVTGLFFVAFRIVLYPVLGYRMIRGFELYDVRLISYPAHASSPFAHALIGVLPDLAPRPLLVPRLPLRLHVRHPADLVRVNDQERSRWRSY